MVGWNIGGGSNKDATRIADLEEKIGQLSRDFEEKFEQLSRDFGQHQKNSAEALRDKDQDIRDLSDQLERLRLQVGRHQNALQEGEREVKHLSGENRDLREILNDNGRSLEHLEETLGSVREDNARLHGLIQRVCICLNEQGDVQGYNSIDIWNLGCKLGGTSLGTTSVRHVSKLRT